MCSQIAIEKLFTGGNKSLSAYPVRAVYCKQERNKIAVEVLISVAKRHLHHAVDRNRAKRQLREAYRKNKHILLDALEGKTLSAEPNITNNEPSSDPFPMALSLAFIWLADDLHSSAEVEEKVINLLQRIAEQL